MVNISVVTGTLDRKHLLSAILDNTIHKDDRLELVLVDGGSTDGTQEYIKSLNHPRIKLVELGHRSSYAHYMNIGVRAATHEIIAQWNDDVELINEWDDVFNLITDTYSIYRFWFIPYGEEHKIKHEVCINFGLYRKDVYRKVGLYNYDFDYYFADSEMCSRAKLLGFDVRDCTNIVVKELVGEKQAIKCDIGNQLFKRTLSRIEHTRLLPPGVELL